MHRANVLTWKPPRQKLSIGTGAVPLLLLRLRGWARVWRVFGPGRWSGTAGTVDVWLLYPRSRCCVPLQLDALWMHLLPAAAVTADTLHLWARLPGCSLSGHEFRTHGISWNWPHHWHRWQPVGFPWWVAPGFWRAALLRALRSSVWDAVVVAA